MPEVSTVPEKAVPCTVIVALPAFILTSPPKLDIEPDSYVNVPTLTDTFIAILIGITEVSKEYSSIVNSVPGPIVNLVLSAYFNIIPPSSPVWRKSHICNS